MRPDKSGTRHFWQQRATAIASVPLVLFLLWFIISHLGATRADVVASVQNPINAILLVLSFASIVWHMRLGMLVLGLLVFRLLWGLVGGRWSRVC